MHSRNATCFSFSSSSDNIPSLHHTLLTTALILSCQRSGHRIMFACRANVQLLSRLISSSKTWSQGTSMLPSSTPCNWFWSHRRGFQGYEDFRACSGACLHMMINSYGTHNSSLCFVWANQSVSNFCIANILDWRRLLYRSMPRGVKGYSLWSDADNESLWEEKQTELLWLNWSRSVWSTNRATNALAIRRVV